MYSNGATAQAFAKFSNVGDCGMSVNRAISASDCSDSDSIHKNGKIK